MVIAAHISSKNIAGSPLLASLLLLAEKNKADRFIIFSEKALSLPENMIPVQNSPASRNVIFQQYWYSFALPALLKKHGAQLFISDTGIVSGRAQLPQFLFFSDHFFEYEKGIFFKKNFVRSLLQVKKVFTAEDFITQFLTEKNNISPEKINTVYHRVPASVEPVKIPAEIIKEKFTGGHEYFLFPADMSSAAYGITVLKAFSQLKKRLKSSMKLVLLLNNVSEEELVPDFKNYKYRDDVLMISREEKNAAALIPNAYALIWLSSYTINNEAFPAMQNDVPVIAEENDINKSLFGDAVAYTKLSEDALSEKMQLLYKDEFLKTTITTNAAAVLKKYDGAKAAEDLYRGITEN